jgi:hypothetical protein
VRAALGARREAPDHWAVPSEATIRRSLSGLDADALAAVIGAWLALAEPGSVLHIGVMGDSEQDARQHFVEARTNWQAIFQPNQEEAVSVG